MGNVEMAPWLAQDSLLSSTLDNDKSLYNELKKRNEEELAKLDEKIKDAEENLGETELSDALRAKASYLAKIGEKVSERFASPTPSSSSLPPASSSCS